MVNYGFQIKRLSETVFRLREQDHCDQNVHVYVIVPHGALHAYVIDTGTGENNTHIAVQDGVFNTYNIDARPFIIINTHNHFDHVGGNHFFLGAGDCQGIWASSANRSYTSNEVSNFSWFYGYRVRPYTITQWLDHNQRIHIDNSDNIYFHIFHTPGHTPDSICIYYSADNTIFAGDFIYSGAPVLLLSSDSSIDHLIDSCDAMTQWIKTIPDRDTVTLACGHLTDTLSCNSLQSLSVLSKQVRDREIEPTYTELMGHMYINEHHTISLFCRRFVWLDWVLKPFISCCICCCRYK